MSLLSVLAFDFLVLPASVWVEVEAAAVEVDRRLEVLPVAEAAGGVPDPLDLRVQAFGRRVGDPVAQVGEDVRQVRLEHPRLLDHGLEPRVGRPEVPVAEKPAGGPDVAVLPKVRCAAVSPKAQKASRLSRLRSSATNSTRAPSRSLTTVT